MPIIPPTDDVSSAEILLTTPLFTQSVTSAVPAIPPTVTPEDATTALFIHLLTVTLLSSSYDAPIIPPVSPSVDTMAPG